MGKGLTDLQKIEQALEQADRRRAESLAALEREAKEAKRVDVAPSIKPMPRPTRTPMTADELEQALQEELASMRRLRKTTQP